VGVVSPTGVPPPVPVVWLGPVTPGVVVAALLVVVAVELVVVAALLVVVAVEVVVVAAELVTVVVEVVVVEEVVVAPVAPVAPVVPLEPVLVEEVEPLFAEDPRHSLFATRVSLISPFLKFTTSTWLTDDGSVARSPDAASRAWLVDVQFSNWTLVSIWVRSPCSVAA
jgi:hypothetical protein